MKAFLKNLQKQLKSNNSTIRIRSAERRSIIAPSSSLRVGEVFAFNYLANDYTVVVIATNKTKTGQYMSNRDNLLVTCIKLSLTNEIDQTIITAIYNRANIVDYETLTDEDQENTITKRDDSLNLTLQKYFSQIKDRVNYSLFGKSNFRTFKVKDINNLVRLNLGFRD